MNRIAISRVFPRPLIIQFPPGSRRQRIVARISQHSVRLYRGRQGSPQIRKKRGLKKLVPCRKLAARGEHGVKAAMQLLYLRRSHRLRHWGRAGSPQGHPLFPSVREMPATIGGARTGKSVQSPCARRHFVTPRTALRYPSSIAGQLRLNSICFDRFRLFLADHALCLIN